MNKNYNEPEFKVLSVNSEDVITTSGETPNYTLGQFESIPFDIEM